MLLNVIKGPYPSLSQMDTEKMKSALEAGTIERGSLLYVNGSDEWQIAGVAQAGTGAGAGAFIWIALQPDSDLVAVMAGTGPVAPVGSTVRPKIAALAVSPTIHIETDMYLLTPKLGEFLKVGAGGKFTKHSNGATAIGRVTRAPYMRWVNNAPAVVGWRTGNNVTAIRCLTMYVPCMPA